MGYIQKAAEVIQEGQKRAKETSQIQYIFDLAGFLFVSSKYDKAWIGRIYPGGRTELKGALGVAVEDWKDKHDEVKK